MTPFNFYGKTVHVNLENLTISRDDLIKILSPKAAHGVLSDRFEEWVAMDQWPNILYEVADGCGQCDVCTIWALEFIPALTKWLTWEKQALDAITVEEGEYLKGFKDMHWGPEEGITRGFFLSAAPISRVAPWDDRCAYKTGVQFDSISVDFQYRVVHVLEDRGGHLVTLRLGVEILVKSEDLGEIMDYYS